MNGRVPVAAGSAAHVLATLSASTVPVSEPNGAVVVVDSWAQARAAAEAGAIAVVLVDPRTAPSDAERTALASLPVALDRPLLRADAVALVRDRDRAAPGTATVGDVTGPDDELRAATVAAAGWLRALAGAPLSIERVAGGSHSAVATLRRPAGAASLVVTRTSAPLRVRVTALGQDRIEVEADTAARSLTIAYVGEAGTFTLPPLRESTTRAAIRRALAALDGRALTDLEDFEHDHRIGATLLERIDAADIRDSEPRIP